MTRAGTDLLSAVKLGNAASRRAGARHAVVAGVFAVVMACTACQKKVAVPALAGQDVDQAKQTLTTAQLKAGNITGDQGAVAPGSYVVTQSPQPGTQVPAGSAVDLTIEAPVTVPDLKNAKLTDAVTNLQLLGLKVAFIRQPTFNIGAIMGGGPKVAAISPPANTPLHKGSLVTLTVSAPPDLSSVLGQVTKEPGYQKLDPEYKKVLDAFLAPGASRDASPDTAASGTSATGTAAQKPAAK